MAGKVTYKAICIHWSLLYIGVTYTCISLLFFYVTLAETTTGKEMS